jgi:hypothetical protein
MFKDCPGSLKGEMPFVGLSMWSMIINDNKPMDGKILQVMRCHLCYKTVVLHNPKIKPRKGLISY